MIKEIIDKRRTIRKFTDEKVNHELLEELLMYSLMGPSYANARPVQFLVVEDKEGLEKLSEVERFSSKYVKDAPCAVVVMADTDLSKFAVEESTICASYLQLLAEDAGLATSWISLRGVVTKDKEASTEYVKREFGLPKNFEPLCVIPIGYRDEKAKKRVPFDVSPKVHYEKF